MGCVCVCASEGHKQLIIAVHLILIGDECANYNRTNKRKQKETAKVVRSTF